jgi:hypothetical protein
MAKNKPKVEETALTIPDYAIMQHSPAALQEVIAANIGTGGFSQGDLDTVRVPLGGAVTWSIQTIDGETASKQFDGVIAAWKEPRAYWQESLSSTGGGTPPDCSSEDGVSGIGEPGGSCAECPFSQWGSAIGDDGKPRDGQACRQRRLMAVVQKGDLIPVLLSAPATSLAGLRRYFLRLASASMPYYGVVTRFTLKKARSKGGIDYSEIEATSLGRLSDAEMVKMKSYVEVIGKSLERRASRTREDFTE